MTYEKASQHEVSKGHGVELSPGGARLGAHAARVRGLQKKALFISKSALP
jgi:hypothetical protein